MLFFDLLTSEYPAELASAMVVNFQIAAQALVLGLILGGALAMVMLLGRLGRVAATPVLSLMRAAPTFVVMFFLLNIIPSDFALWGISFAPSPKGIVALSLVPFAAAYAADNGISAISNLRKGAIDAALLFIPSTMRAFFVLVMSSGAGAAIGVHEGVAVVLRMADQYSTLGDKMVVFALGVLGFGIVFQLGFGVARMLVVALRFRSESS